MLLVVLALFFIELDKSIALGSLFACFVFVYFFAYKPLFYFFKNAFCFQIAHLFLIYLTLAIVVFVFFDHSLNDFFNMLELFLGYILIEGLAVFYHEYKS